MQVDIAVIPPRKSPSSFSGERGQLTTASEDAATELGQSGRILVVEDDFLIANQIESALTDAGFEIAGTTSTGEEALELAEAKSPILAVMDIRLAGKLDGIDTALELARRHGIRCIFASAYSDQEARRRAAAASPFAWLQKPYSMASLTAAVRTVVNELRVRHD